MNDIFQLLGIKATYDFVMVKEAYIEKVTAFELMKEEATEEQMKTFSRLIEVYNHVDSGEKLAFYMNMYYLNPNKKAPIHLYTDVFMTVPFGERKEGDLEEKPVEFKLPLRQNGSYADFAKSIDFNVLANVLTNRSSMYTFQVGLDEEEALEIVNLHRHNDYYLVIRAKLPMSCVTPHRATEGEVSNAPNIKHNSNFHWLSQNTVFNSRNIVSVRPMYDMDYKNSRRQEHYRLTKPCSLWWENITLINQSASLVTAKPQQFFSKTDDEAPKSKLKSFEFN